MLRLPDVFLLKQQKKTAVWMHVLLKNINITDSSVHTQTRSRRGQNWDSPYNTDTKPDRFWPGTTFLKKHFLLPFEIVLFQPLLVVFQQQKRTIQQLHKKSQVRCWFMMQVWANPPLKCEMGGNRLGLYCCVSGFVVHSSAFELSDHTWDKDKTQSCQRKSQSPSVPVCVGTCCVWAYLEEVCLWLTPHTHLAWSYLKEKNKK